MIWALFATLPLLAASVNGAAGQTAPADYCRQVGSDDTLHPVPPSLVPAVVRSFGLQAMPPTQVSRSSFFRCAEHRVLVCTVGANLHCGKADMRRDLPGVAAWCASNPGSPNVPASVTGHATIYAWRCDGAQPLAYQSALTADERGFIAPNWKRAGTE